MLPHLGVHGRAKEERLYRVPCACHAGNDIVTYATGNLAQGVGVQRRNHEHVRPFHQVYVQHRIAAILPGSPLHRVGQDLDLGRQLSVLQKVLGSLRHDHPHLQIVLPQHLHQLRQLDRGYATGATYQYSLPGGARHFLSLRYLPFYISLHEAR